MIAVHKMYQQQNINEIFGFSKAERQGSEVINQLKRDVTHPRPSGPQIRFFTSGEQLNKKRDFFNVR